MTAPATKPYIVPDQFQIVVSHMNRLWFADNAKLALYYLPLQQKSGELKELPLNAIFKRGGSIRAVYTWTLDGGMGLDDQLVIFSTNGEAAIYNGTDPDSDFNLIGVYRFDSPMSKHAVVNYGGELLRADLDRAGADVDADAGRERAARQAGQERRSRSSPRPRS